MSSFLRLFQLLLNNISPQWLGYLMTEGMDSISYFAVVPFLFDLTKHMTDDHHISTAITNYGMLFGSITLARFVGKEYLPQVFDIGHLPLMAIITTITLFLIAFCYNFIVVVFLFLLKESIGSCMSGMYLTIYGSNRLIISSSNRSQYLTNFTAENLMRRNLTICVVGVISCLIYSDSPNARFPAYYPCILLMLVWILLIVSYELQLEGSYTNKGTSTLGKLLGVGSESNTRSVHQPVKNKADIQDIIRTAGKTPQNFIDECNGNEDRARKMYIKCLEWRYEYDIDNLLTNPQPHFDDILRLYPHGIHGRSLDNCVVLYEILGRAKVRDLANVGITLDNLVWHFNLRNEYIFQKVIVEEDPVTKESHPVFGYIMTVIDVKGIALTDLSTDVISFIKQSSDYIDNYYPGRVKRLVICNAPSWFSSVWGVITRVLPEKVRLKINIIHGTEGLDKFISPSQRPVEYGGTCGFLGSSPEHRQFLQLAKNWEDNPVPTTELTRDVSKSRNQGNATTSSSSSSSKDQMKWSWGGLWKAKPSPKQAFLGKKNSYRFDDDLRSWTLDTDDIEEVYGETDEESLLLPQSSQTIASSSAVAQSPSILEEHSLLLAIQAAHMASQSNNLHGTLSRQNSMMSVSVGNNLHELSNISVGNGTTSSNMIQGNNNAMIDPRYLYNDTATSADITRTEEGMLNEIPYNATSNGPNNNGNSSVFNSSSNNNSGYGIKLLPDIFLVSLGMYLSSSLLHVSALTLIPVWMMLPTTVGGLGYTVTDVGLVVSSSALLLLLVDQYLRDRLLFILKSSPLRMMRISGSIMALASILLPLFLGNLSNSMDSANDVNNPSNEAHIPRTPSRSIIYLPIPCILLATFVCSAYVCRKSSTMLLQVALSPVFINPFGVVRVLGAGVDVLGPTLACLCYRAVYDYTLHHREFHGHLLPNPLNTMSFFSLSLTVSTLLYCCTFLLSLQFRGDFGIMPDLSDDHSSQYPGQPARPTTAVVASSISAAIESSLCANIGVSELIEIMSEDFRLLLAPPRYGYGSKLYNLKVDLKDL